MTHLSDPRLHLLLTEERARRLRDDGVRAWSSKRRPLRRRFGFVLVAVGRRLASGEAPQPRHSTP